jgi:hypothetical protein
MAYIGNSPGVASQRIVNTFTATAGQTTFTPSSGYTIGYVDVYLNGIKLVNGTDYTASNGSTVVFTATAAADDVVEVMAYIPRGLSDGYTKSEADARYEPIDSAYTKAESDSRYATSAQGSTADSAVQPGDLSTVATSGAYADLSGKPTNVSSFTNDSGYATTSYVDTAESDAVATANAYTDAEIANISVTPAGVSDQANTSTGFFALPSGTSAQRPTPTSAGYFRFNTSLNLPEYFDGSAWTAVATPPAVNTISPTVAISPNTNISIYGSSFKSGATVVFIGNDGTEYQSPSVTFVNTGELTAQTPTTTLSADNEPYDVKVINPSSLSAVLLDALDAGATPTWNTAQGQIAVFASGQSSVSTSVSASDPDGQSVSYSLIGSLPPGLSLNSSSGVISGNSPSVGSSANYSFTIRASDGVNTADRGFSIRIAVPTVVNFNSTQNWTVPAGVTSLRVVAVAGGGGAANRHGGGGGAGGMIDAPAVPVNAGQTYTISIGGAGSGGGEGYNGGDTTCFGLTAKGGGGGKFTGTSNSGGSGGGATYSGGSTYGNATQPSQSGLSGTYGYGHRGGVSNGEAGGGGGGAGGVGVPSGSSSVHGSGGPGRATDISGSPVYYAGGGAGAGRNGFTGGSGGIGGGGASTQSGQSNTGGGGGGNFDTGNGGNGGSGKVIVSYLV